MPEKKKRKRVSTLLPITRSVRELQSDGWVADIAERKMGKVSRDWAKFADIVAIRPGFAGSPRVLLVQATGWGNTSDRVKKVMASEDARRCYLAGCQIEVWGWDRYREHPKIIPVSSFTTEP